MTPLGLQLRVTTVFTDPCRTNDDSDWRGETTLLTQRSQLVQNAAARLIVDARKFDPVSHILCDLHWLPVRQRITFELCVLAYKCLNGMTPATIPVRVSCTNIVASHRPRLRSSSTNSLLVPRTRTCYADRNIAVASPAAWNDLPAELTDFSLSPSAFYSAPQCSHCQCCTSYGNSVCLAVRLSVRLLHAGIVSKRRHVARCGIPPPNSSESGHLLPCSASTARDRKRSPITLNKN